MHIIFGTAIADELRQKHTVLQLESFPGVDGEPVTAYCVVTPESIIMTEMPDLERLKRLHQAVVDAWNRQDYHTVMNGIEHLHGRFGGELDSFYSILEERIKTNAT